MCFVADKKERSVGNPPSRLKVAEPIRKAPSAMSTWISRTMHALALLVNYPIRKVEPTHHPCSSNVTIIILA